MEKPATRRQFVRGLAATAAALNFQVVPSRVFGANDRITLAGIGTSGKGASDIANSASAGFQVTHLCDIVNVEKYPNLGGAWAKTRSVRLSGPALKSPPSTTGPLVFNNSAEATCACANRRPSS